MRMKISHMKQVDGDNDESEAGIFMRLKYDFKDFWWNLLEWLGIVDYIIAHHIRWILQPASPGWLSIIQVFNTLRSAMAPVSYVFVSTAKQSTRSIEAKSISLFTMSEDP